MDEPLKDAPADSPSTSAITGFAAKVSRYFLDFLETDFKKQQAPRRKISLQNDAGFRTGLPVRKYPTLYQAVWKLLATPTGELAPLRIARGRYTAPIGSTLRDLIRQHVDSVDDLAFEAVRAETLEFARRTLGVAVGNPEKYVDDVQTSFAESVSKRIVTPILAFLDGPFRQQSYSALESVYEVETDLVDLLTARASAELPAALNTFIVSSDLKMVEKAIDEFFSPLEARERVKAFFEDFATADAYQELRDLINYMRFGGESLQIYLYVCDLRLGTSTFPIFYIPASVIADDKTGDLVLELDPHLYIHKRAIDYIAQELGSAAMLAVSPVDNRIIYVDPSKPIIDEIARLLTKMSPTFDLIGDFDVRRAQIETVSSTRLRLTKAAYFAVFDKSDESLLNDYEALLTAAGDNTQGVVALFEGIIRGFLIDEPRSVREHVSNEWDSTSIPERLVAVAPIPLNEEQRRILAALSNPECRFIAVQGPPGTGKSHTITAIAFDCILKEENVLILSDKQEALDVVEDKLKAALAAVRPDDDFPDPILRLGKTANTYTRLISQASQERIRNHYRVTKTHAQRLDSDTRSAADETRRAIAQTIDAYSSVRLEELDELHRLERSLESTLSGLSTKLQQAERVSREAVERILDDAAAARRAASFMAQRLDGSSYQELLAHARAYALAMRVDGLRELKPALSLFEPIGTSDQPVLQRLLHEYDDLRMPLLGYLFRGSKVRALNARVGHELPCRNSLDLHRRLQDLRRVHDALVQLRIAAKEEGVPEDLSRLAYGMLLRDAERCPEAPALRAVLESFAHVVWQGDGPPIASALDGGMFGTPVELADLALSALRYLVLWQRVTHALSSVPSFDYVGSKARLEELYTVRMTHEIDRRFVDFIEKSRTTAKTLGGVIKAKQQFPQTAFASLKEAFPCIIASIREFAEYVPLQSELFDVVVIDEASQVSVAQAFPALLRAKKVVVLGDQKQFSNVKSSNASIALNQGYLSGLEQHFRVHISDAADRIQRLKQFDIKRSVLEFFDLVANYSDMLRKHFRGYQELISFSSKHFYGGQLQAIKVRGVPLEDVIEFSFVEPADRAEKYKNTNTVEADFILRHLRTQIDEGRDLTVGVITPFREQQQYLTRLLFADSYAPRFEDELRLKVMTFDTCQGEERDLILYSMVATPKHDLLNYVFPVSLDGLEERAEETLKAQRLNVGFSRAKEKIHFVLSKPIDQYRGSIARVLAHYQTLLEGAGAPDADDTDPSSPMERKVLDWITKTSFYQQNKERVELIAQFPVGDYLRQLDPTYQHPAYRCDFLLRYQSNGRGLSVIIEYDGFQEHFINHNKIHAGNYDAYYRPQDIERQMVLESYGYKFLRINRFNLGRDPVSTLSERLHALVDAAAHSDSAGIVGTIREGAVDLAEGSAKHCRKCDRVKPDHEFFDARLAGGKGGYGQICLSCKGKTVNDHGRRGRVRRY